MNTDAVIFLREMREAFGDTMTIEDRKMEQSKTYRLNSDETFEALIQKLKYQWRQWWTDGKPEMEIEVRFHKDKRRVEQNDAYWTWIRKELAPQMAAILGEPLQDVRVWDELLKQTILGIESHMVGDKLIEMTREHKTLGVRDFADYHTQCCAWAADVGVVTEYAGTMGVEQAAA